MAASIAEQANRYFHSTLSATILNVLDLGLEDRTASEVAALCGNFTTLMGECESPIEQILASGLLWASDELGRIRFRSNAEAKSLGDIGLSYPWHGTVFLPQVQYLKTFRVDFLIVTSYEGRQGFTVVECDGHEFHERTKEQAARDRSRDRALTLDGNTVLRFTGSELHRDLNGCVGQIEAACNRHIAALRPESNELKEAANG